MSNDYTYRDPRLSLWQSAASVTQSKRSQTMDNKVTETPSVAKSTNPFMVPVHAVARTILDAGKPLESLIDDVKKGIFDLEAIFHPLEDCSKAAARFLWNGGRFPARLLSKCFASCAACLWRRMRQSHGPCFVWRVFVLSRVFLLQRQGDCNCALGTYCLASQSGSALARRRAAWLALQTKLS